MKFVWYACYGSNLCEERFKCYIAGGYCKDNGREYSGCTDKTLWTESFIKEYLGKVYFGNSSGSWGGKGVAFYDSEAPGKTIMRLYKITSEQLAELHSQEGNSPRWYDYLQQIDEIEGLPVFTITSTIRKPLNPPSDIYLNVIKKALVEECNLSEDAAEEYVYTITR